MNCPCCDSKRHDLVKGQVFTCRKCGAIHGTAYLGDSYGYVLPYMAKDPVGPEALRYFDFTTIGSEGIGRRHGWYDPTTKLIHQVG